MKRRDILKSGLLGLVASSLALSGCDKNEKENKKVSNNSIDDDFDIIPKQTDTYKLSVPMLFHYEAIDKYVELNKQYKKSQITTLYNSIPWPQSEKYNELFMLYRGGGNPAIKTYSDFEKYVKYSFDKGFDVVYLMNSPKAFNDRDFEPLKKDFYKLLDNLWKTGIRKIKFANTQVAQLINEYNPNFQLSVATILEYSSISQYRSLVQLFPNINHICVPKDLNQNFRFLASLKKAFPKIEIEMMVDEGCLKWCPTRFSCMASSYNEKYKLGCRVAGENRSIRRTLNGVIYSWNFEYYSALGINNFKIVPTAQRASDNNITPVIWKMQFLEYGPYDDRNSEYINWMFPHKNLAHLKEILSCMPDMKYFVRHGHECSTKCGVECNYCYECAKRLEQKLLYS